MEGLIGNPVAGVTDRQSSAGPSSNEQGEPQSPFSPPDPLELAIQELTELVDQCADGRMDRKVAQLRIDVIAARHKDHGVRAATLHRLFTASMKPFTAQQPAHATVPEDRGKDTPDPIAQAAERDAAWELCKDLAQDPGLMKRLLEICARLGVAGDACGVLSTYAVAASRFLSDPCRMVRVGASASGKNYVIDAILKLLPPDDYIKMTSASPKAMIYSQRDFRHRLLYIGEMAALVPDKSGNDERAMMVRELISSGEVIHSSVQPTGPNGSLEGVEIHKEGPVAVLVTTARNNIEEELLTRLLVSVTDETDKQTLTILGATARRMAGDGPAPVSEAEIAKWHAFQDWLRLGHREVVVPFAPTVASLVKRTSMRTRRDFPHLLSLTKAFALVHRAQRHTDASGRIVAEVVDYAMALAALGEGLEEIAHGDTSTTDTVYRAINSALMRRRWSWARDTVMGALRVALHQELVGAGHAHAAARLSAMRRSQSGRVATATMGDCIRTATQNGQDATVAQFLDPRGPAYGRILRLARGNRKKSQMSWPTDVELSSQQLANLLGINRGAVRVRLDHAIEAGAVIDVGASDPKRARTAPRLLAPGNPPRPAAAGKHSPRGAFPAPGVVRDAFSKSQGGRGCENDSQAAKQGVTS